MTFDVAIILNFKFQCVQQAEGYPMHSHKIKLIEIIKFIQSICKPENRPTQKETNIVNRI